MPGTSGLSGFGSHKNEQMERRTKNNFKKFVYLIIQIEILKGLRSEVKEVILI